MNLPLYHHTTITSPKLEQVWAINFSEVKDPTFYTKEFRRTGSYTCIVYFMASLLSENHKLYYCVQADRNVELPELDKMHLYREVRIIGRDDQDILPLTESEFLIAYLQFLELL